MSGASQTYGSFLILATILPLIANSQVIEEIPTDQNGKINFTEVIQVDSVDKNTLYSRSKQFFVDTFKSANDVIQLDDKESGTIIGKGFSDIYIKIVSSPVAIQMWYSIKIQCKDGRYKYEIYDIIFKSYASQYAASSSSPAEPTFDRNTYYKKNAQPRDVNEKYICEMILNINKLTSTIKATMNNPAKSSKENEW